MCLKGILETVFHCFWECEAAQRVWTWCSQLLHSLRSVRVVEEESSPNLQSSRDLGSRGFPAWLLPSLADLSWWDEVVVSLPGAPSAQRTDDAHGAHSAHRAPSAPKTQSPSKPPRAPNTITGTQARTARDNVVMPNEIPNRRIVLNWKHCLFAHRLPRRFKHISRIWLLLRGTATWMLWKARNDASINGTMWHFEKTRCKIWLGLIDYGRIAWDKLSDQLSKPSINPDKTREKLDQFRSLWCCNSTFARWDESQPRWHLSGPALDR